MKTALKKLIQRPETLTLMALVLLLMFNLIFTKGFFTLTVRDGHLYGSLIDIIKRAVPLLFVSLGMTLVIATGGTDISVGAVAAISAAVAANLVGGEFAFAAGAAVSAQNPLPLAILAALAVATLCGCWNGFLVAKIGIQPLVVTLMLQVAGRGISQLITKGQIITVYYKPFAYFGTGWFLGLPVSIFIFSAVSVCMYLFTRKTAYGMFLESAGNNRVAARFAGLKVQSVIWIAFALSGLMAGIAGLLTASEVRSADPNTLGMYLELDAILACVIGGNSMKGGRFTLAGSMIGALLVQTLTTTIYMKGIPSETILVYKAVVVILVGIMQGTDFRAWGKRAFGRKTGVKGVAQ